MMRDEQEVTAPLDTAELESGWATKQPSQPRKHTYLLCAAKTDLGQVRENNEDKFDSFEPDDPATLATKGRVYAVADGMGGYSAGQIASEMALNVFIRAYLAHRSPDIERALKDAVREANEFVVGVAKTVPGRNGMGTTLTAAVIRDDDMFVTQVGDSRCYLLRDGVLDQLTEDHSWVAEQVRSGAMSLAEAEQSPFRNVITRSIGGQPQVVADVYALTLQPGDRILLCSDGLSGFIPPTELFEILSDGSASVAAWNMIERANHHGGRDNITAYVLDIVDIVDWHTTDPDPESAREPGHTNGNSRTVEPLPAAEATPASEGGRGGLMGRLFGRG